MHPYLHLFGRTIGTYGACMALAFLVVVGLAIRKGRTLSILPEDILLTAACAVGCGLLCGKLLYIAVTYSASELLAWIHAGNFDFLKSGGIVFYGGLFGGIGGSILGAKLAKWKIAELERVSVPYIPLGHAIGRIGCMMAGCCYGIPYNGFGALHYPDAVSGVSPTQGYFPVQLLEAALDVGIFACLRRIERTRYRRFALLFTYLGMYGIVRFVTEFLRGDSIRGIYAGFSTSQWISLCTGIAYAIFALAPRFKRKQTKADRRCKKAA